MTSNSSRRREAFSLVEAMLALAILAAALGPIVDLFTGSHRSAHASYRMVQATLHVQSIVEALALLEPDDFPEMKSEQELILMADVAPPDAPAGSERYRAVREFFRRPVPVQGLRRTIVARRLASGEVEVRGEFEWSAMAGDESTNRSLELPMLSLPRNWQ